MILSGSCLKTYYLNPQRKEDVVGILPKNIGQASLGYLLVHKGICLVVKPAQYFGIGSRATRTVSNGIEYPAIRADYWLPMVRHTTRGAMGIKNLCPPMAERDGMKTERWKN